MMVSSKGRYALRVMLYLAQGRISSVEGDCGESEYIYEVS